MDRSTKSPLVKICGITSIRDGVAAVEMGADLIGLNFWPRSPRSIELEPAKAVVRALREAASATDRSERVKIVGVFVNRPRGEIATIDETLSLDLVQLHGDEDDDEVNFWGERAVKAFRGLDGFGGGMEKTTLARYPRAWGFLVDADAGPAYGGTGRTWAYERLRPIVAAAGDRPVLVAGGIAPGRARRALTRSGAAGVDSCSGLETAPGEKDLDRMKELMMEIHNGRS